MSTPSPPPLLSSSSGDSSNASLATLNMNNQQNMNRVSIQNLCNDGASIKSASSGHSSNRRGSIQDILNDEPMGGTPGNGNINSPPMFATNTHSVSNTPNGATPRYSQNDYFAAEMLGNLKATSAMSHGGAGHVASPPPRAHNPFEVPIQIQPGYQPLKGLYSDVSIKKKMESRWFWFWFWFWWLVEFCFGFGGISCDILRYSDCDVLRYSNCDIVWYSDCVHDAISFI